MAIVPNPAVKSAATPAPPAATAPAVKEPLVLLELRHINRYRRGGALYEKGIIYEFTKAQAAILLGETHNEVSVWKRTTAAQAKAKPVIAQPEKRIINATKDTVDENVDEDGNPEPKRGEALEIGNDEEIADILGMVEADHTDVEAETETV